MSSINRKQSHDNNHGTMYFDTDVDSSSAPTFVLSHKNLAQDFDRIIGKETDNILNISVYETPLNGLQITAALFFHSYLVFETEYWYCSIETSDRNITLQRSKKLSSVRDKYLGDARSTTLFGSGPKHVISARGKRTIRDMIKYLYDRDRVNLSYNIFHENCKDLAKWLFDKFNDEGKTYSLTFTSY